MIAQDHGPGSIGCDSIVGSCRGRGFLEPGKSKAIYGLLPLGIANRSELKVAPGAVFNIEAVVVGVGYGEVPTAVVDAVLGDLRSNAQVVGDDDLTESLTLKACGAIILPDQKPSLLPPAKARKTITPDPQQLYYYSVNELRDGIQAFEVDSVAKSSRILGVIVQGSRCYCLYHTGHTRMYWMQNNEENTVASIDTLLTTRVVSHQKSNRN